MSVPADGVLRRHLRLTAQAAWRAVAEMYNSEALTHAASISYYALLSLFPFLLLLFSVLGSLTADQQARDGVIRYLFRYFPQQFEFIARQLDAFRAQTLQLGVGGLLALIWASLGVFNAISSAVNHAWGVERRRSFLKHRLVSFVMMLSAAAIAVMALLLLSATHVSSTQWFFKLVESSPWLIWAQNIVVRYAATLLLVCCVALVFYFIPNTRMRFRDVWPGAITTGLLWEAALNAFTWYARDLASWNLIHGSIAAVVVFLIWIYVCAVVLLYGVQMTAAYVRLQAAYRAAA
ncbi:MAG: YihY/virulence factor BrkB family protein [Acidobacteria bacterium]|nr:YihY/virulence factor BrkB family protein [Acidobacteriota bacterium]